MTENPWITAQDCAKKRNGPSGALTPIPALEHSEPEKEVRTMSLWVHIGDSRHNFKTEHSVTGACLIGGAT